MNSVIREGLLRVHGGGGGSELEPLYGVDAGVEGY
jgi:hypothetical protein